MIRRLFLVVMLFLARDVWAQPFPITPESNGDHRFPDVVSWGGYDCGALPRSSVAGATTHCRNCLAESDPAVCGGKGCNVERIADDTGTLRWRCVAGPLCNGAVGCTPPNVQTGVDANCQPVCGPAPTPPCPAAMICPPPTVQIGTDGACGLVCSTNFCEPNPCLNGGECILSGNGFVCLCPCNCTGLLCETCAVSTTTTSTTTSTSGTGTTVTTTSTTSTTSTSTSTTLPLFDAVTFMAVPSYPTDEGTQAFSVVANDKMICGRFVAEHSLSAATKLGFRLTTGMSLCSSFSGVGLYPDSDGGGKLASCTGFLTTPGVISCTGLTPFSLVRGTSYRICGCNDPFNCSTNTGAIATPAWLGNGFAALDNGLSVSVGTAANGCAGGVPATTGAITQDNSLKPPEAWLSVE